jgi:1-acyl-sn-glycerol-3-phosphate acyltransferase
VHPRDVTRSALLWAGLAGVVLAAVPPMVLGYPLVVVDPNRKLSDWYFRMLGKALVGLNPGWRVTVEGREHLAEGGPFVLVVNHGSFVDLMAMGFLDHPTKYIGKESLFKIPVFGWALAIAGEVPVRRGDRESGHAALERLGEWLDRGVSVGLFPEGTRSSDGTIGSFKLGAFKLAIEKRRPIVPVVLTGARALLPKDSFVFEREADIRVRVLPPVSTDGLGLSDVAGVAADVRAKMIEAFERGANTS